MQPVPHARPGFNPCRHPSKSAMRCLSRLLQVEGHGPRSHAPALCALPECGEVWSPVGSARGREAFPAAQVSQVGRAKGCFPPPGDRAGGHATVCVCSDRAGSGALPRRLAPGTRGLAAARPPLRRPSPTTSPSRRPTVAPIAGSGWASRAGIGPGWKARKSAAAGPTAQERAAPQRPRRLAIAVLSTSQPVPQPPVVSVAMHVHELLGKRLARDCRPRRAHSRTSGIRTRWSPACPSRKLTAYPFAVAVSCPVAIRRTHPPTLISGSTAISTRLTAGTFGWTAHLVRSEHIPDDARPARPPTRARDRRRGAGGAVPR